VGISAVDCGEELPGFGVFIMLATFGEINSPRPT